MTDALNPSVKPVRHVHASRASPCVMTHNEGSFPPFFVRHRPSRLTHEKCPVLLIRQSVTPYIRKSHARALMGRRAIQRREENLTRASSHHTRREEGAGRACATPL